jgi:hypothetical protein
MLENSPINIPQPLSVEVRSGGKKYMSVSQIILTF